MSNPRFVRVEEWIGPTMSGSMIRWLLRATNCFAVYLMERDVQNDEVVRTVSFSLIVRRPGGALRRSCAATPPAIYDEGLIVQGAERILHGQRPYVDFTSGYPPGQFYTIALVFRVFGSSLMAERIWDSIWRLGIVAAAAWLARELAGPGFRSFDRLLRGITGALDSGFTHDLGDVAVSVRPVLHLSVFEDPRCAVDLWRGFIARLDGPVSSRPCCCAGVVLMWSVWRHRRPGLADGRVILVGGPSLAYLLTVVPWRFLNRLSSSFQA